MAEIDASYKAKVGRVQGGGMFYMKEDGQFKFFDNDYTGLELKRWFESFLATGHYGASGTTVSGPQQMSRYGAFHFTLATGLSLGNIYLPSAIKGCRLFLNGISIVGDGNMIVDASTGGGLAGVSLLSALGTALSSVNMSAVSQLELRCYTENVWSVYDAGSCTLRNAA